MSAKIDGTPFTIDFVLEKLRAKSGNKCDIENLSSYDVKDITNGSAFMSNVFKVTLRWIESSILPTSVILKVPGTTNSDNYSKEVNDEEDGDVSGFLEVAHAKEMSFYEKFPQYDKTLKLPKYYYGYEFRASHSNGIIIMEDLTLRGLTIPMLPGFSHDQICSLIDALAHIHCVSWKERDWIPSLSKKIDGEDRFINSIVNMCFALKKIKPEWFADILDEIIPFIKSKEIFELDHSEEKYGFPASIVHSDLWAPNVLWTKDANNEATSDVCAIIDWQMARPGNPCEDLCRLLSLNVSSEYRRKNTPALLKHYHAAINAHFDGKPPCTLKQIEFAYRSAMPTVVPFTAFGTPMYHEMPSVVGPPDDPSRPTKRLELLDRVHTFFEDALVELKKVNKARNTENTAN